MTESDLRLLKASIDKVVKISCGDGEILVAKVHTVSDEDEDVIYDLISTTRESHYEKHDEQPAYLIHFRDIESVEPYEISSKLPRKPGTDGTFSVISKPFE